MTHHEREVSHAARSFTNYPVCVLSWTYRPIDMEVFAITHMTGHSTIGEKRVRQLRQGINNQGPVCYWMSRDQRVRDNWALLYSQELALQRNESLIVLFCLVPEFLDATARQYDFMITGLREVETDLRALKIPFRLLTGAPESEIPRFITECGAGALVTDFDPLKIKGEWKEGVANSIDCPVYEVDTHNIVPCWLASPKQEYAARTFRPKITRLVPEFLDDFPPLEIQTRPLSPDLPPTDWPRVMESLNIDKRVAPVTWLRPGEGAGHAALRAFLREGLHSYDKRRNDPTLPGQSDLSPYLHFGQLSAQRIALEVHKTAGAETTAAFMEELVVRRELADNFCFYNEHYDSIEGFPAWAQKTLAEHARDERPVTYDRDRLEGAETHDDLWNAAQMELVIRGKMHGYMRMYWAKKILEWSATPQEALATAIYLNDRYELDGRDPSGYTGCAWSIGGVHDRAWFERPLFGKIRYMSYNGCKSKFAVNSYIQRITELKEE